MVSDDRTVWRTIKRGTAGCIENGKQFSNGSYLLDKNRTILEPLFSKSEIDFIQCVHNVLYQDRNIDIQNYK